MEKVVVNTELNGFTVLNSIEKVDDLFIEGTMLLESNENFLILEAMAQLASLHVKKRINYSKHSFLLKIKKFDGMFLKLSEGKIILRCNLVGMSSGTFSYDVCAYGYSKENNNIYKLNISSSLIISTTEFSNDFKEDRLKKHYEKVMACLLKK